MSSSMNKFYSKSIEISEILKKESFWYFIFIYSIVIFQLIIGILFLLQKYIFFQISFITYTILFIPATVIFALALDKFYSIKKKSKKSLQTLFTIYYIIFWISFLSWVIPFLIVFNFNLATVYFI